MTDSINDRENESLADLYWRPGMLVGFDNTDFEMPAPLLLTLPTRIVRGHSELHKAEGELRLIFNPENGEREEWTLISPDKSMQLWPPGLKRGIQVPQYSMLDRGYPHGNPYVIESAHAGQKAIEKYLRESKQGLGPYANWLRSGKLYTQRGRLGNWMERKGLDFLLPAKMGFRRGD